MKKRYCFNPKKALGRKSILAAAVSLLLITTLGVTSTVSWIEDVSQVEFSSDNGQQTPLHIGSKILYSDARMKDKTGEVTSSVDLNKYFQESGNMHLSPCYGDGENFFFPVQNDSGYRIGTKDDANVNYLSVTFRVQSLGASTAYWFEKTSGLPFIQFKEHSEVTATDPITHEPTDYEVVQNTGLEKYLRCSITVDGATNVYCADDTTESGYDNTYHTIQAVNNVDTPTAKTGRSIEQFSYCNEVFSNQIPDTAANAALANQGPDGANLNGNTLFTVNKYDDQVASTTKIVTLKIWLEYGDYYGENSGAVAGVDIASLNLNIVSGWDKTRRIYVVDKTIDQYDEGLHTFTGAHWLTGDSATLHWAINGNETNAHWASRGNITNVQKQYFDIPAVYNSTACTLYRCGPVNPNIEGDTGWNTGNAHSPVNYWDYYPTTFPNTFHSETYTVYTQTFGTWSSENDVRNFYFVNSTNAATPYSYMWDHNTEYGTSLNDKVVMNHEWPGEKMEMINDRTPGNAWEFVENNTSGEHCTLNTTATGAGYYKFTFTISSNKLYVLVTYLNDSTLDISSGSDTSYYLVGLDNNWNSGSRFKNLNDSYTTIVHLEARTSYTFKIKNENKYYSNTGTISGSNDGMSIHTFFYTSVFDRAVFNDGREVNGKTRVEYQTQDLTTVNQNQGKYFDMATLTWFDDKNSLPTHYNVKLNGDFCTSSEWVMISFASDNNVKLPETNSHWLMCKVFIKSSSTGPYKLSVLDGTTWYGKPTTSNTNWSDNYGKWKENYGEIMGANNGDVDVYLEGNTTYRFYYDTNNHYFKFVKET